MVGSVEFTGILPWRQLSRACQAKLTSLIGLNKMQASLSEMIPPGCLVMLTPVVVGILFGTRCLAGVLAGALVSGVQMAVSMSNTGGAWDNAKKYVEVSPLPHASSSKTTPQTLRSGWQSVWPCCVVNQARLPDE